MKNFLILTIAVLFISCGKDDITPFTPPAIPDYADSLVGTYLGQEILYDSDNSTQLYNNGSKTLTVTRMEKNKIMVSSFNGGSSLSFFLSEGTNGTIKLKPINFQEYATGWNSYSIVAMQLNIYIKNGSNNYQYFQGIKQ
jgi:hypothetical protein